jgi:hypothetical protein
LITVSEFRKLAGDGRSADMRIIDWTHVKAHRSAAGGKGRRSSLLAVRPEDATRRFTHSQVLRAPHRHLADGRRAHGFPLAERLICSVKPSKHMLGDKAYGSAELRGELDEWNQTGHSQLQQQETTV